jgi:hypothetical protein
VAHQRGADGGRPERNAGARARPGFGLPLWSLALKAAGLAGMLALAVHHPAAIGLAAAISLWVLWSAYGVRGGEGRWGRRPSGSVRVRYLGGHPDLPAPGVGWLRSWPADGAAVLRVGGGSVAFPLAAVQGVALTDGRVEVPMRCRGPLAAVCGRLLARGTGRYCGLRRHDRRDYAIIDRSRVVCDIARPHGHCRLVLAGPRGGGEDIYLETLVLLRPVTPRGHGAAGGHRASGAAGGA